MRAATTIFVTFAVLAGCTDYPLDGYDDCQPEPRMKDRTWQVEALSAGPGDIEVQSVVTEGSRLRVRYTDPDGRELEVVLALE